MTFHVRTEAEWDALAAAQVDPDCRCIEAHGIDTVCLDCATHLRSGWPEFECHAHDRFPDWRGHDPEPVYYDDPDLGSESTREVLPGDRTLMVYAAGDADTVTVVEVRGPWDITVRLPDGRLYATVIESLCEPFDEVTL